LSGASAAAVFNGHSLSLNPPIRQSLDGTVPQSRSASPRDSSRGMVYGIVFW